MAAHAKNKPPHRAPTATERATVWVGSVPSLVIHTLFFAASFALAWFGVKLDTVLLVLTTAVSLEAIYLAIFIQMSVNRQAESLRAVETDIDEIQEDVEEISEDVEEIQENVEEISKDVDEISEDVEEISKDVGEIQKDIDEVQENVEEISKDVGEISEDVEDIHEHSEKEAGPSLDNIEEMLKKALADLERLKEHRGA